MTPLLSNFFEARHKPRRRRTAPGNEVVLPALSKKAGNRGLNAYTHLDRLWESPLRRRPLFNSADLSRALADLAGNGAGKAYVSQFGFANSRV
jgi:hypothetical protein